MQQSLSRVVGTHMTLIGLLSSSLMPSAAFAAMSSDTEPLTVNVNSVMTINVNPANVPVLFNGVVPGDSQQKVDSPFTIATNGYLGFNVTAIGANVGSGACDSQVLCHTTLTTTAIADVAARYDGTTVPAAQGTGTELGLVFRLKSTATGLADNADRWGADGVGTEKFAAFPVGTAKTIVNQSTDASGSMGAGNAYNFPVTYGIKVPGSQTEGSYQGTITYTATSN